MSILQVSIDAIGNDDFGTNDQYAMSGDKPLSQSPVTDLVKVNTTVANAQFAPAVAALSGGGYIIVWEDSSAGRIFAQRFSAAGAKVGNELQLDSTQGGSALWVSVAATANDGFVIAFQAGSFAQAEIFGRRYDGANAPVGGLFAVNSTSPNEQFNPHITALDNGATLFTWDTQAFDVFQEVHGRIFLSDGQAAGPDFVIAPMSANAQHGISAIAPLAGGSFVVTWQSATGGSSNFEIVGQRFSSNGTAFGSPFTVNTQTTNNQYGNDVARLSDGSFVISWIDPVPSNGGGRVVARHFDASGNAIGGEIVIDSKASGAYGRTVVSALENGGYVVSWTESDAANNNVLARQMGANDVPTAAAFEMAFDSPFGANYFSDGAVTLSNGDVVFTWDGPSTNTSQDIYTRLYDFSTANNSPTEGDDVLTDTNGNDTINALGGNDRITLTNGRDSVTGGSGTDTLVLDWGAATVGVGTYDGPTVNGGGGLNGGYSENNPQISSRLASYNGIERFIITTGSGGDDITTASGDDEVRTGAGDDRVNVGTGVNIADGGADVDAISADLSSLAAGATVDLGSTVNSGLYGSYSNFEYFGTITGSAFDDVFVSTNVARIDTINAGAGSDAITVRNGRDVVDGGTGSDTLTLDWTSATQGLVVNISPTANPNGGFDGNYSEGPAQIASRLVAYAGIERFAFRLGSANDSLTIATALDTADGGGGTDLLSGSFAGGPAVDIDLVSGTRFINFEGFGTITGSAFDDRFVTTAAALNENLSMGYGNDSVAVANGRDTVAGELGNDTLVLDYTAATSAVSNSVALSANANGGFNGGFAEGNAQVSGRVVSFNGFEQFVITTGSGDDAIVTGSGDDMVWLGLGNDTVDGGEGNDALFGEDGADSVSGGAGFDKVDGGGGNDILNGGTDSDTLRGGDGDDVLDGGADGDALNGGAGVDILTGGAGRDKFRFGDGDTGNMIATADRITDLDLAQGERVSLTLMDAIVGGADDAFTFIGTAAFGNVAGQLRYELIGGNTYVMGDTNGDSVTDFMIRVDGSIVLTGADFAL